jgi:hypothetical protein
VGAACSFDILLYLTPLGQGWQLIKHVVHKISSVEGNLFIFGLVYFFCPDGQKINILIAQYKQISNKQGVCRPEIPKGGCRQISFYCLFIDVLLHKVLPNCNL